MDTIAAIATPPGVGGIAVLRISGPEAISIAQRVLRRSRPLQEAPSRRVLVAEAVDPQGQPIDQVLVTVFRAPHSYTGEDVVEISCHGGRVVPHLILEALIQAGARLAEPGEFTKRAFLNGKLDLIQAAAVQDLVEARSREGVRQALRRLRGEVSQHIEAFADRLFRLIAELEARIDFEEDVPPLEPRWIEEQIQHLIHRAEDLIQKGRQGNFYLRGVRVALVGPPNAGKSTLFNRLLGEERAIVTEIPGTTRDVVSEERIIAGVPVKFLDTAGLRTPQDPVESLGVERTRRTLQEADLAILVLDLTRPEAVEPETGLLPPHLPVIRVWNKADLAAPAQPTASADLLISALTGQGLDRLRSLLEQRIRELVGTGEVSLAERELHLMASARADLQDALQAHRRNLGMEIVVFHLREAHRRLQEIVGYHDLPEAILDHIFKNFCVGK